MQKKSCAFACILRDWKPERHGLTSLKPGGASKGNVVVVFFYFSLFEQHTV
jgi:hypothetical protein